MGEQKFSLLSKIIMAGVGLSLIIPALMGLISTNTEKAIYSLIVLVMAAFLFGIIPALLFRKRLRNSVIVIVGFCFIVISFLTNLGRWYMTTEEGKKLMEEDTQEIGLDNTSTPTITEAIPTVTATPTNKPKPTVVSKPVSVIDENLLRTRFALNVPDLINQILNDHTLLEKYERDYYNQLKGWPELKTTATEQRIYLPGLDKTMICQTAHIVEIKKAAINYVNTKAKTSVKKKFRVLRVVFCKVG